MRTSSRMAVFGVALSLVLFSAGLGLVSAGDPRPDKAEEGKLSPALTVTGWKNSKALDLDSLKGQVVVLKFWATWCGPCKSTLPHWNEMSTKTYKDKKVAFIAVHAQKDCDKMADFVDRNKFGFPCCKDDQGTTAKAFGAKELPFNVLIDKKGNVRKLDADIKDSAEIDKLLSE